MPENLPLRARSGGVGRRPRPSVEPDTKPRVLIATRSPVLRTAIRDALESSADCTEADGAAAAVDAVSKNRRDVCFLDAGIDGGAGHAVRLIQASQPKARVVLITTRPTEAEFLQSLRLGAAGYLQDTLDPERLPEIVRAVVRGEAAVPRVLVQRLIDEVRSVGRRKIVLGEDREVALTRREGEVLDLIRDGLPTHAIARRLGIADVTVRRHRATLCRKLGMGSNSDLRGLSAVPLHDR